MNTAKFLRIVIVVVLVSIVSMVSVHRADSWGFFAHKQINRLAVFTLPPEMLGFYKRNIEFITEHAVDPDKRRYAVIGEAQRHYIDLDNYGDNPFENIPRKWDDAVAKFSEDTLQAHGIVPWHIDVMVRRLTFAFKNMNLDQILRYSSDLGHYVGDAHVPLHTTKNYNGQLTNQKGIHGFWESRLPELFSGDYNFFVGKARYIDNVLDFAWETVRQSFAAKDSVLEFESELNARYSADRKYAFENRGAALMRVYSEEYSRDYHIMLNGMVERRMRQTIIAVGSLWYTAWVNAGQPDLRKFYEKGISSDTQQEINELYQEAEKGNTKGRVCD
jgi:hypothetical protein